MIEIAYKSFGSGEPLVMITGYIATLELWDPLFVQTLASDYRVVIFDNRGTGETTGGTADWTIDQFADNTAGLIEAISLQRANVLGWSMGGDIALGLAVRHPDKVSKLIVYAGDCGGPEKVVTGDEDVSTPPENADILAERIPDSRLIRFAGAGHGLQYQYPREFAKVVTRFLDAPQVA